MTEPKPPARFGELVAELANINCALWHEEDKARGPDDTVVAAAKREIDRLNQRRNDRIEAIDMLAIELASGAGDR